MTTWVPEQSQASETTAERAQQKYQDQLRAGYANVDQFFAVLLVLEWSAAVSFALAMTPYTWAGETSWLHIHVWASIVLGGAIVSVPVALTLSRPAHVMTRHAVAVGQMLMSVLLIHLAGGRIEVHFHVFVSLAFLALYRDWKVLITASAIVAADHLLRGVFWPRSVYGVLTSSPWRWLEHSAWVVFEDIVLMRACRQSCEQMRELAGHHAEIEVAHARVEQRVRERTADLSAANRELTRQAIELRESETMMASIIESAPDAIVTMDHLGVVSEFNPAAVEIFGYSKEASLGRRLEELIIPPEGQGLHGEAETGCWDGAGRISVFAVAGISCMRADGSVFPAELTVTKVIRIGVPPLFVGFVRDIAMRKLAGGSSPRGSRERSGGQSGQERVSRQHEPRDSHAHERNHRHDRAGARYRYHSAPA